MVGSLKFWSSDTEVSAKAPSAHKERGGERCALVTPVGAQNETPIKDGRFHPKVEIPLRCV